MAVSNFAGGNQFSPLHAVQCGDLLNRTGGDDQQLCADGQWAGRSTDSRLWKMLQVMVEASNPDRDGW